MKNICRKEKCTGCGACYSSCQHDAIEMKPDWRGFLRPVIHRGSCVDCGLCKKICPANSNIKEFEFDKAVAFIDSDARFLRRASSGGAFGVIARYVISHGGIVFGATMDEEYNIFYKGVETIEDLKFLHGSKYVQAYTGNAYREVKERLKTGRMVLFCGCPCQVAGLKHYLNKEYPNLITMDLICHGVPSQPYFRDYVHDLLKRKAKDGITTFRFRHKEDSCRETRHDIYVGFHNKDYYMTYFLWGKGYRKICYHCCYAGGERQGDFTIGDFVNNKSANIFDNVEDGASLVLINTQKAESLLPEFEASGACRKVDSLEKAIGGTGGQLKHPSKYDIRCDLIYILYRLFGVKGPKVLFKLDSVRIRP